MGKVVICGIDTSLLPKLSGKESEEYIRLIKNGDTKAREKFIISNFRLVLSVIKRFFVLKQNSDDLFQAGTVGLIKAVDNFDNGVGVKFSTYAVPLIIGEIKKYLRDKNSLRVARSIRDTAYEALKVRAMLDKEGKDSSITEIAKVMKESEKEVAYSLDAISDTVSLFDPVYSKNGDELLLLDTVKDEKNTEESWAEKYAVENALNNLGERERKIIYLRYYTGKTQTEISLEVGISQAQVSRLEKNALKELKARISC